jgi:hypothetical protein
VSKFRVSLFIVPILVIALAIGDAVLASTPTAKEPDFIDTILASKAVVAAIRITLIFAAFFVVLSVAALTVQRRWLVRVGPLEVSDRVSALDAENRRLEKEVEAAKRAIDALEQRLRMHINC